MRRCLADSARRRSGRKTPGRFAQDDNFWMGRAAWRGRHARAWGGVSRGDNLLALGMAEMYIDGCFPVWFGLGAMMSQSQCLEVGSWLQWPLFPSSPFVSFSLVGSIASLV